MQTNWPCWYGTKLLFTAANGKISIWKFPVCLWKGLRHYRSLLPCWYKHVQNSGSAHLMTAELHTLCDFWKPIPFSIAITANPGWLCEQGHRSKCPFKSLWPPSQSQSQALKCSLYPSVWLAEWSHGLWHNGHCEKCLKYYQVFQISRRWRVCVCVCVCGLCVCMCECHILDTILPA